MAPTLTETQCTTIASPSRIEGIDYTINPYFGCAHGCRYCYVRNMPLSRRHQGEWGTYVCPKVNAPEVLRRELPRMKAGLVSFSTVTDPYQPAERQYGLTRRLMRMVLEEGFAVSVLSKSPLVTRDLDVMADGDDVRVGASIVTLDDTVRKVFEPGAPPVGERIGALEQLAEAGIYTWVFVAPTLPYITEETIVPLLRTLGDAGVKHVTMDRFNPKPLIRGPVWQALEELRPGLSALWRRLPDDAYEAVERAVEEYPVLATA